MTEKRTPTGFVARCQCGVIVGAMDYTRTDRAEAGKLLGKWISDGCTIEPRFTGTWQVTVEACRCEPFKSKVTGRERPATELNMGDMLGGGNYAGPPLLP